jgi:methionyl-tRNA formyltransferase
MGEKLDILFAGTPEFSVLPLRALLDAGHSVIGVYTQPDRPAGRGRKLTPSPVKQLAVECGLPVYQPLNFKDEEDLMTLESLGADLMVVVAYGLILPRRVLAAPRLGCVNIHASLLPRWRGAAPIQRALLAGDTETGVTIMQMEAGLDTGPMLLTKSCPIEPSDTAALLHDRLSQLGAAALLEALPAIADGSLEPVAQDDSLATYASKLSKDEGRIDWRRPAVELDRQVRAFNPWPVAQTEWQREPLRIWRCEPLLAQEGGSARPGRVVHCSKQGIDVATGVGLLRILELQAPGKRAMTAGEFLNAQDLSGVLFG